MQVLVIWMFAVTLGMAPTMAEAAVEAACGVDRYEPNDARGRAKSTRGKPVEARVCGGDVDWYYVKLEAGTTVEVVVEAGDEAAVDVGFYPPRSRKPQGKATRADGRVVVRYRVTEAAKHRIRVSAKDGAAVPYLMTIRPAD